MSRIRGALRFAVEIIGAIGWLGVIETSMRTSSLPATCRRLGVRLDVASSAPPATDLARLPRWSQTPLWAAHTATARWPVGDTCLRRCLLIGHRLRALEPVLRIGVRRDADGAFSAHSWLEFDGRTLDADAAGFAALGCVGA